MIYLYIDCFFFFNDAATTEIYTLSLHDALPISRRCGGQGVWRPSPASPRRCWTSAPSATGWPSSRPPRTPPPPDRKSTRLNSSHANISYAVFCLKKKKNATDILVITQTQQSVTV